MNYTILYTNYVINISLHLYVTFNNMHSSISISDTYLIITL